MRAAILAVTGAGDNEESHNLMPQKISGHSREGQVTCPVGLRKYLDMQVEDLGASF